MSEDLCFKMLRWSGKQGRVKGHGYTVDLDKPPEIRGRKVWFIDYRPEVHLARIQPTALEPPRDMEDDERRDAEALINDRTAR